MSFEVEAISEEIIKQSSPTLDNLRHYSFSFLDQIAPPVYNPLLLFYESKGGDNTTEISNRLKNSLAQVLTLYYPLAGRIRGKRFVDCNDEGVPFVEARVLNCTLSDVLSNPIPAELNKLLPFELDDHVNNEFPLGVQLNIFPCGGIAIGQCLTHKIADGLSYFMFSKIWAAISRGESQANIKPPQFVSAALFPPKEFDLGFDAGVGITKDTVTRRFVFSASTLETLGEKYEEKMKINDQLKSPTRVETLSAFITSRVAAATTEDCNLYRVLQAVNLRPKFDPPLPQESFGNFFSIALTSPLEIKDEDQEGDDGAMVIMEVRGELSKIDNGYIKKLQKQGDEHLGMMMEHADGFKRGETAIISFSSYCRFPLYDNDFGWGTPAWVGSPSLMYKNLVLFMDRKEGDGIEAYVSLEKKVMARFQCDRELLSCVSATGPGLN